MSDLAEGGGLDRSHNNRTLKGGGVGSEPAGLRL